MNRLSVLLHAVQFVALAVLLYLVLRPSTTTSAGPVPAAADTTLAASGGVYYVNFDTLKAQYAYYQDTKKAVDEQFRQFSVRAQQREQRIQQEFQQFQQDVEQFQRSPSLQTNAEAARLQAKEQDLIKKRQEYDAYIQNGEKQLAELTQEKNTELLRNIQSFLNQYQAERDIRIVLSYSVGDAVLYADPELDITTPVVAGLNANYTPVGKR